MRNRTPDALGPVIKQVSDAWMNADKRTNVDEAAERLTDSASQLEAIKRPTAIKDGNFA